MWGAIIGGLMGAKMGGDAYWWSDEPKWKTAAASIGGGVAGALAGWAMAPAAAAGAGGTAAGSGAASGAGAAAGGAAAQAGVEASKQAAISAAAEASMIGSEEAALLATAEAGQVAAQTVGQTAAQTAVETTAEQSAEALLEAEMLEAGKQTGMGSLEAMPEAGLEAANTTGMDANSLFSELPQYQQYGSNLEQLGARYDQVAQLGNDFWAESESYRDAFEALNAASPQEQQQQQGGMPSQTRGGLREEQAAGMQEGIESELNMDMALFQKQFMGGLSAGLSGAFRPLQFGESEKDTSSEEPTTQFGIPSDPRISGFDYGMLKGDSASDYNWDQNTMFNY